MSNPSLLAEWHANQACWLAWPSHPEEWLGDLDAPRRAVAEMATAIADVDPATGAARGEHIDMLVLDQDGHDSASTFLERTPVRYHRVPFGDIWLRDTGPILVVDDGALIAACFAWNGWGNKYLFEHDADVAERIASIVDLPIRRYPYILEGGAIDTDGKGTVMTTRQCLLAENRRLNGVIPDETVIEHRLADALGIEHVIWLERGLDNDHTDGHVDTLARFVGPARVVCMCASERTDPNRANLDQNIRELQRARTASDRQLDVIEIPSPGRILGPDGSIMPASYMNFYIGNTTVVVPTYGSPSDREAVDTIDRLFPTRRTVGVDARALITGGGAFHCITKHVPAITARSQVKLDEEVN